MVCRQVKGRAANIAGIRGAVINKMKSIGSSSYYTFLQCLYDSQMLQLSLVVIEQISIRF